MGDLNRIQAALIGKAQSCDSMQISGICTRCVRGISNRARRK